MKTIAILLDMVCFFSLDNELNKNHILFAVLCVHNMWWCLFFTCKHQWNAYSFYFTNQSMSNSFYFANQTMSHVLCGTCDALPVGSVALFGQPLFLKIHSDGWEVPFKMTCTCLWEIVACAIISPVSICAHSKHVREYNVLQ